MTDRPSFDEFDFDLAQAVLEQLVAAFRALPIGELNLTVCASMGLGQGVYQLFLDTRLMYIGKADNLPSRLERHFRMLSARQNIDIEKLGFKALFADANWISLLEVPQISEALVQIAPWNGNALIRARMNTYPSVKSPSIWSIRSILTMYVIRSSPVSTQHGIC